MITMYSEEELLALSGIQHMAFCPRQWALIHIECQWAENVRTIEGKLMHEKADNPFIQESRGNVIVTRSIPLASYEIGLYGIADVVEFKKSNSPAKGITIKDLDGVWIPHPVEYKRGKPKPDERDIVQLCAQAICLEEMYKIKIESGSLYYGETRHHEQIGFDDNIRGHVKKLSEKMHHLFAEGITPSANYTKRCKQCSMMELCMPKLAKRKISAKQYLQKVLHEDAASYD